jgi:hypothetical protein
MSNAILDVVCKRTEVEFYESVSDVDVEWATDVKCSKIHGVGKGFGS